MKISFFFLFVCTFQLMAVNAEAQNAIIKVASKSLSIAQLISEIEKQTDYLVVYSNQEIDVNRSNAECIGESCNFSGIGFC